MGIVLKWLLAIPLFLLVYIATGGIVVPIIAFGVCYALVSRIKRKEAGDSKTAPPWIEWSMPHMAASVFLVAIAIALTLGSMYLCYSELMRNDPEPEPDVSVSEQIEEPSSPSYGAFTVTCGFTGAAMDIFRESDKPLSANQTITVSDSKGARKVYPGDTFDLRIPAKVTVTINFSCDGEVFSETVTETITSSDYEDYYDRFTKEICLSFFPSLSVVQPGSRDVEDKMFSLNYKVYLSTDPSYGEREIMRAEGDVRYVLASTLPPLQPYCGLWIEVSDYCGDYNHVGNEWTTDHYISLDGSNYTKLQYSWEYGCYCTWINASAPTHIYLKTYISEYDDAASDSYTNWYDTVLDIDPETQPCGAYWTVNQWCDIVENGGRYIYNSCRWDTTWTFTLLYGEK